LAVGKPNLWPSQQLEFYCWHGPNAVALPVILKRHKVVPKDLINILENNDPEDISIVITKINFETSSPNFDIKVTVQGYNNDDNVVRQWTIKTVQYRKSKISLEFASTLELNQNHPILWQFSNTHAEIYVSGHCSEPDKLFVSLYKIHKILFEDLIPFSDSIRDAIDFNWLTNSPNGLLAQGPKKLMTEYANILGQHNLEFSIVGERVPTYWDGEKHVTETGNAQVLFIDNSYIIADEFQFL
jgi:hypothetical protein